MTPWHVKLALAVVLQTLVLMGMIVGRQHTLSTGTEVKLRMQPIDPRSLFRGDYVILSYDITRIPRRLISGAGPLHHGKVIYAVVKKKDHYWSFVSAHRMRPQAPKDHVVIKGRIKFLQPTGGPAHIGYGIESYFIPEGEGRDLERPKPGEELSVLVAVDRWGNAAIKALLVDGVPRYAETLF